MKERRLTEGPNRCVSKRHKSVWLELKKQFPKYRIYNEYPYSNVVGPQDYKIDSRLRADIFIKDISATIEVMGEQHYFPVAFGGDVESARGHFIRQQRRDSIKRELSETFGFVLLELPYFVEIPDTHSWLDIFAKTIKFGSGPLLITGSNDEGFDVARIDLEGTLIEGDADTSRKRL